MWLLKMPTLVVEDGSSILIKKHVDAGGEASRYCSSVFSSSMEEAVGQLGCFHLCFLQHQGRDAVFSLRASTLFPF